jgi:hypothetical protein
MLAFPKTVAIRRKRLRAPERMQLGAMAMARVLAAPVPPTMTTTFLLPLEETVAG